MKRSINKTWSDKLISHTLKFCCILMLSFSLILLILFHNSILKASKLDFFFKEINIKKVAETYAVIEWETSIPSQGTVKYGFNEYQLFGISYDVSVKNKHSLRLNNLKKGTLYYFKITASSSNHKITSPINRFKTKGIPTLNIIINKVSDITKDSVKIEWAFTQPVRIKLKYVGVTKTNFIEHTAEKIDTSGAFIIKELKPDASYYYVIEGKNEKGEIIKSKVDHFKTAQWNFALNKPVEGTFTQYITSDPYFDTKTDMLKRVTDGKMNYFNGMAVSSNVNIQDQYLIIDLQKIYPIKKIAVYWRALSCSRDYSIFISNDKKKWKLIREKIDAKKGKSTRGEKGDPILFNTLNCNTKAQYLKLFIEKGSKVYNKHKKWNFVQIMEIKILN